MCFFIFLIEKIVCVEKLFLAILIKKNIALEKATMPYAPEHGFSSAFV